MDDGRMRWHGVAANPQTIICKLILAWRELESEVATRWHELLCDLNTTKEDEHHCVALGYVNTSAWPGTPSDDAVG